MRILFNSSLKSCLTWVCCFTLSSFATVISYVDTTLKGSQKLVLRVDGKPYYGTEIQVRLDKLRYYSTYLWTAAGRAAIMAQLAADHFSTVALPIHWYEIEPSKDNFSWAILDEYLDLCKKNNLKCELLWFSTQSGGSCVWLGDAKNPVHLRVPDYVIKATSYGATSTTSEFIKTGNYTVSLNDATLRAREAAVVGKMMAHVASWDSANGSPHTVLGIQLGNETVGFPQSTIVSYYSALGATVKNSGYSVWTRMNEPIAGTNGLVAANEQLRASSGTNIDFCGGDIYHGNRSPSFLRTAIAGTGKNYRAVMEIGADTAAIPQINVSAVSSNLAFNYYEAIGPDDYGLYTQTAKDAFKERGAFVATVRIVNSLINSDQYDIATLAAQGSGNSGMFVHNWAGNSASSTTGVRGVSFTPGSSTSQGISIARSEYEIVLMNTLGGTFNYPASLDVKSATKGYFDSENKWISQGEVTYSSTSITPPAGSTVRLLFGNATVLNPAARGMASASGYSVMNPAAWLSGHAPLQVFCPKGSKVQLSLYSISGKKVESIVVNGHAGVNVFGDRSGARALPRGVYIIALKANGTERRDRVILEPHPGAE